MVRQVTKTALAAEEYAEQVLQQQIRSLFQDKETRDAVGRVLTYRGHKIKRSAVRNAQLHPEYVTDFVGTYETGFGNIDYQTSWAVLYAIEVQHPCVCPDSPCPIHSNAYRSQAAKPFGHGR